MFSSKCASLSLVIISQMTPFQNGSKDLAAFQILVYCGYCYFVLYALLICQSEAKILLFNTCSLLACVSKKYYLLMKKISIIKITRSSNSVALIMVNPLQKTPLIFMMTSSNGNIFRVTDLLCGEFTGQRWIPHTKANDTELYVFFDLRLNK